MIKWEKAERSVNRCGGTGVIEVYQFLDSEDMQARGMGCTRLVLPVGSSIGIHQHLDSVEQYYVISGCGVFHDNGEDKLIAAGQIGVMEPGAYHGIANTGETEMVVVSVHLFT